MVSVPSKTKERKKREREREREMRDEREKKRERRANSSSPTSFSESFLSHLLFWLGFLSAVFLWAAAVLQTDVSKCGTHTRALWLSP
jgi:hypothetical protein